MTKFKQELFMTRLNIYFIFFHLFILLASTLFQLLCCTPNKPSCFISSPAIQLSFLVEHKDKSNKLNKRFAFEIIVRFLTGEHT